jgi:hypothetical protein
VGALLVLASSSAAGLILGSSLKTIYGTWPALIAASVHYGVLFAVLPLLTTRAAAVGLVYVLVWESVLSFIPGAIHTLTATYYVRALLPGAASLKTPELPFLAFLSTRPTAVEAVARLAITATAVTIAGAELLRRREYSVSRSTDEGV